MSSLPMSDTSYRRELGDGLLLRWSNADDVERLARFYPMIFREGEQDPPNPYVAVWVRDMMSGRNPHIGPDGGFALVEETRTGTVVAATCLLSQVWDYDGIPCPIGRPEIVGTDPAYRNRGLIRAIFELVHARSAALGHIVQGITGIYWYYRQFGYEYALALGGRRTVFYDAIPPLKPDTPEPYTLRDATLDDVAQVKALYDHDRARVLVSTEIDEDFWRWTIAGMRPDCGEGWLTRLIVDGAGATAGYMLIGRMRYGTSARVLGLGVRPGVSLAAVLPSALRAARAQAAALPVSRPETPPADRLTLVLGHAHPLDDVMDPSLLVSGLSPYAWYVRVADLPGFLRHVAPALERRLAGSAYAGYSGELCLDFYRDGLRLVFEHGRLTSADPWRKPTWGTAQAGFPPLVFLQLVFGFRSLAQLREAFPDVWTDGNGAGLLQALFPARPSWVLPLE